MFKTLDRYSGFNTEEVNSIKQGIRPYNFNSISGYIPQLGNDSNTIMLLHFEDRMDSGQFNLPIKYINTATVNSTAVKFGTNGLNVNTSPANNRYDCVAFSGSHLNAIGTGPFTVDFWHANTRLTYNADCVLSGPSLYVYVASGDSSVNFGTAKITPGSGTWFHTALVGDGAGTIKCYFNGVYSGMTNIGYNISASLATNTWNICGDGSSGAGYGAQGYIDEFRVSNIQRWTGNFTVPSSPYTS